MNFHIKIYQIKKDEDLQRKFLFTKLSWLENGIKDVDINNYEMVYENCFNYALPENRHEFMDNVLENIFTIFNVSRPEDFKGHSLSISDIIEVDGTKYFVNDYGFVELKNGYRMSEKDKALVAEAINLEWDTLRIHEIYKECESEEAKEKVHRMIVDGYHMEEARYGML